MSNRKRVGVKPVLVAVALWFCACGSGGELPPREAESLTITPSMAIRITVRTSPMMERNGGTTVSSPTPTVAEPTQAPTHTSIPPSPEPTPEPVETAAPAFIPYTIKPGDTLLGVAMEFGVSMASIQLANSMGNSIDLIAGQTLSVPGSTQWLDEGHFWTLHVVDSGETLVGIASTYNLSVDDILRVNAVADPDMIHIQQQLVIPLKRLVASTPKPPAATAAPPVAIAAASVATTTTQLDQSGTASDAIANPAAAPAAEAQPPASAPIPAPPAGPEEWSGYILARINQVRAEHGLNTLSLVQELTLAAQAHAQDCAARGWGSHVGSDGAVLKTRLERAGYYGPNRGENWVQARNAERAFDWWYGEIPPNDPHRRNILSPHYAEIGIGIAATDLGYIFVTDFGRR
jgi:uncharacterized protein YkwD